MDGCKIHFARQNETMVETGESSHTRPLALRLGRFLFRRLAQQDQRFHGLPVALVATRGVHQGAAHEAWAGPRGPQGARGPRGPRVRGDPEPQMPSGFPWAKNDTLLLLVSFKGEPLPPKKGGTRAPLGNREPMPEFSFHIWTQNHQKEGI